MSAERNKHRFLSAINELIDVIPLLKSTYLENEFTKQLMSMRTIANEQLENKIKDENAQYEKEYCEHCGPSCCMDENES